MADRVDRTERLLNLVFALMGAERPVPRGQIRQQVPGYSATASDAAFERMFERDKDELRSMGIPVETILDDFGDVQGYVIPADAYAMEPIDLSLAEQTAVAIAAQVWGRAVVAPVVDTALRKLESVSLDPDSWMPSDLQGTVQLTCSDAALMPLMTAIRTRRVVTFDYRAPSSDVDTSRTVSPWRLTSHEGHWLLRGHDHTRDAERTFRLSRIQGVVTVTAQPSIPASEEAGEGTPTQDAGVTARVRARPRRGASLRRVAVNPGEGWREDEWVVQVPTLDRLVSLVCAAGPDVVVLEPAEAVDAVREALTLLVDQHGGASA